MLKTHRDAKVFCSPLLSLALKMVMSNTKVRSTPPVSVFEPALWQRAVNYLICLYQDTQKVHPIDLILFVCFFLNEAPTCSVFCCLFTKWNVWREKKSPAYWRKFPRLRFSFLVCATGMIDCPGNQDGSSLRSLIDKPPVCGNSFSPLTGALLTGFRLHTGPVLTPHDKHKSCFFFSIAVTVASADHFTC